MTTNETRTHLPDDWEARRRAGLEWAWSAKRVEPSIIDTLAGFPQIASRRVASEIIRELTIRGLEIHEIGKTGEAA